jgi:hypothetical protein
MTTLEILKVKRKLHSGLKNKQNLQKTMNSK